MFLSKNRHLPVPICVCGKSVALLPQGNVPAFSEEYPLEKTLFIIYDVFKFFAEGCFGGNRIGPAEKNVPRI